MRAIELFVTSGEGADPRRVFDEMRRQDRREAGKSRRGGTFAAFGGVRVVEDKVFPSLDVARAFCTSFADCTDRAVAVRFRAPTGAVLWLIGGLARC